MHINIGEMFANRAFLSPQLEAFVGATSLLYDAEFADVVDELRVQTEIRTFLRQGGSGQDPDYELTLKDFSPEEVVSNGGGDDPLIIMYTSGTGRPKGAVLSHQNLFWATQGITHTLDWRYRDRFLSVAPIITNVYSGCTTVFMPDMLHERGSNKEALFESNNINIICVI